MDKNNTLYGVKTGIGPSEVSLLSSANLDLFEIVPIKYKSPWSGDLITYTRIKTENLHKEIIQRVFELRGAKVAMQVIETPIYLMTQYAMKAPIYISKENGRVYGSMKLGYEKGEIEHQAATLLQILDKADLVINLHEKRMSLKNGGKNKKRYRELE